MRIRLTREWIFELPDDTDKGQWLPGELVRQDASWCILTPEGLPLAPSQYPKREPLS